MKINLTIHQLPKDYMDLETGLVIAEELLSTMYTKRLTEIEENNTLKDGEVWSNDNKHIDPEDDEKLDKIATAIYSIRKATPKTN